MGHKKREEAFASSPVEVSELRLWGLQIRLGLSNFVRFLVSLPQGSGRGSSTPAFFIDAFRPRDSTSLRLLRRRFQSSRSFRLEALRARTL